MGYHKSDQSLVYKFLFVDRVWLIFNTDYLITKNSTVDFNPMLEDENSKLLSTYLLLYQLRLNIPLY